MADTENQIPNNTEEKVATKRAVEDEVPVEEPEVKKAKTDEPTELEKKIIRQIEYYFGDINLPRDKFMNEKKDEEGWIPLTVMLTFKRLQTLTTDHDVIINALAKSDTQLVQVSEDKQRLRRAPELPLPELNEERRKEIIKKTAYVKGFPLDATLDALLAWFEDKKTENLLKRCTLDKTKKEFNFKGSVYVTFQTVEDLQKFIAGGPYHYDTEDVELIVKSQEDYIECKRKERAEFKQGNQKLKKSIEKKPILLECSIVHLKNLSKETVHEDIKSHFLTKYQTEIKFVEHEKGQTEAYLRLNGEESGAKLLEQIGEDKIELNGAEIEIRVLEGEELEKQKEKIISDMTNSKSFQSKNKFGGRKNGGGNRHGKNFRKNKGRN